MHQDIWQRVSLGAWISFWLVLVGNGPFLYADVFSEETSQERVLSISDNSPRIQLNETSFDFGEVALNEKATHRFIFQNTGAVPLEILEIKSSCRCTTARVSSQTIEPGASGSLEVTFDSTGRFGLEKKGVRFRTNDPLHPKVHLQIKAFVKGDFEVSPRSFVFRDVTIGQAFVQTMTVTTVNPGAFHVVDVQSSSKHFVPTLTETKTGDGKQTYLIQVKLNPPMTGWKVSGKVKKQFLTSNIRIVTDSSRQPMIEVRAVASRKGN